MKRFTREVLITPTHHFILELESQVDFSVGKANEVESIGEAEQVMRHLKWQPDRSERLNSSAMNTKLYLGA